MLGLLCLPLSVLIACSLKKGYEKHRKAMSDTGQGLLDAGQEGEFIEGSDIANVWGASSSFHRKITGLTPSRCDTWGIPLVHANAQADGY